MSKLNWSKCRKENYVYKNGYIDKDEFEITSRNGKTYKGDLEKEKEINERYQLRLKRLNCPDYNYGWCNLYKKRKHKPHKCFLLENKKCIK